MKTEKILGILIICSCLTAFDSCSWPYFVTHKSELANDRDTGEIQILTKDRTSYDLFSYYVRDSVIFGRGTIQRKNILSSFDGSIKISDIYSIKAWKGNFFKTVVAAGVITTIAVTAISTLGNYPSSVNQTISYHYSGSSCPFVLSYDGTRYILDGEPYGGAICPALERTDWCRLEHLKPVAGEYRLLLMNEMDETQNTDEFKLWVIDHDASTDVMLDAGGNAYTISNRIVPAYAFDARGKNLMKWLSANDDKIWESDICAKDPSKASDLRDTLLIGFHKPAGVKACNLIVSGGTTLLGSRMLKEVTGLRGRDVHKWYDGLKNPAMQQMLDAWDRREELYKLKVKVRIGDEWQTRGSITGSGPFITEERVVPLDLTGIEGDTVEIMLAPASGFWQFNSFAMDFSTNESPVVQEISAEKAVADDGTDLSRQLSSTDSVYYVSPKIGDRASLVFRVPKQSDGTVRTIYAKVSGFYDIHLKTDGSPRYDVLNRIAFEPGYPVRFALQQIAKLQREMAATEGMEEAK